VRENRRMSRRYHLPRILWSPLLQQGGAGFQSSGKVIHSERTGFSPGFSRPALKRIIEVQLFPQR